MAVDPQRRTWKLGPRAKQKRTRSHFEVHPRATGCTAKARGVLLVILKLINSNLRNTSLLHFMNPHNINEAIREITGSMVIQCA